MMSDSYTIQESILRRLHQQAEQKGCSIDDLLTQYLDEDDQHLLLPASDLHEQLLNAVDQAVIATDLSGQIIYWNRFAEVLYGWRTEEMLGHSIMDITPAHAAQAIMQQLSQGKPWVGVVEVKHRNGTSFLAHVSDYPILDHAGQLIGITRVSQGVTKQQHIEKILQEREVKYRLLVEKAHQGIVIALQNPLQILFANQRLQNITGYTPEELLAMDQDKLIMLIHPDDRQRFLKSLQVQPGEKCEQQFRVVHRSGTTRDVNLYNIHIDFEGQPAIQTVILDMTDQLEVQRLQVRYQREQEQNTLIQRIIAMLSHDLRTPLATIMVSRDILHRYFDRLSPEAREEKLVSIGQQVRFAIELLDDTIHTIQGPLHMREFTPKPINLATLCQVSIEQLRNTQSNKHQIVFTNPGQIEIVSVDEILVSRILINLLSNAIKYSPDGGEIRLELDRDINWILLRVSDEGIGIEQTELQQIFDPFYRSDDVKHINGTGLGLNIVKECVQHHKGRIYVESRIGEGSVFTVQLPYMSATAP